MGSFLKKILSSEAKSDKLVWVPILHKKKFVKDMVLEVIGKIQLILTRGDILYTTKFLILIMIMNCPRK